MCLTWLKLGFHRWRAFCKVGIALRTKGGNKEVRFWQCAGGVRGKKEGRAFNPSILMPKSQIDKLKPGTWETPSTTFDNILDLYGFVHFCLELPAPSIVFSALLNLQCCCYCFVFCACVFCFRAPFLWNQDERKTRPKRFRPLFSMELRSFFCIVQNGHGYYVMAIHWDWRPHTPPFEKPRETGDPGLRFLGACDHPNNDLYLRMGGGRYRCCGLLLVKAPTTSTAKEEEHKVDPNLDVSKWNEEVTRVVCALAAAAGKCWKMLGERVWTAARK